jgi:glycosyltransferase involved in cell wall biosynthesis
MSIRIVQLNLAFDPALSSPDALLASYSTLTGWARSVAGAGAHVHVVQRFAADAQRTRNGVTYSFVADGLQGMPRPWDRGKRVVAAVVRAQPDLVHVNGLMFPGTTRRLHAALGPRLPIVLQDHSGTLPRRLPWPAGPVARERWRRAFQSVTACTFTAREMAERWYDAGLPRDVPIIEIPEASTTLEPIERATAAARTAITGSPVILWVGRLDANKDPLTVLDALERALTRLPDARAFLISAGGPLESAVRARVARSPLLTRRVTCVGAVPHDCMHEYYSAADVFVSGSHHEGSGYALIEALACGVTPCVTDIPAFRALVGAAGAVWTPGDAAACARALVSRAQPVSDTDRAARRRHFDDTLHWEAIGRGTVAAYRELVAARRPTV